MIDYGENESGYQPKRISSTTEAVIEEEVRFLVDEGYTKAKKILTERMDDLHKLAKALLEFELLSGDEIKDLMDGKPIIRNSGDKDDQGGTPKSSVPSSVPASKPKKDDPDFDGTPQGA